MGLRATRTSPLPCSARAHEGVGVGTSPSPTNEIAEWVCGRRGRRPSRVEVAAGCGAAICRRSSKTMIGHIPNKAVLRHTHSPAAAGLRAAAHVRARAASVQGPRLSRLALHFSPLFATAKPEFTREVSMQARKAKPRLSGGMEPGNRVSPHSRGFGNAPNLAFPCAGAVLPQPGCETPRSLMRHPG